MPDMPSKDAFLQAVPAPLALAIEEGCPCADYDLLWAFLQANQAVTYSVLKALFPESSWKQFGGN
jgi:hypothetical protein